MSITTTQSQEAISAAFQIGSAVGQAVMLQSLTPALSDGTRSGSSECAQVLQALPEIRQHISNLISDQLPALGIPPLQQQILEDGNTQAIDSTCSEVD